MGTCPLKKLLSKTIFHLDDKYLSFIFPTIDQTAWKALANGEVTITFNARDIAGNEASESITVIKSVPSGLDPGVIITIAIVSIVGGVAVISVVYIFMKKRMTPA